MFFRLGFGFVLVFLLIAPRAHAGTLMNWLARCGAEKNALSRSLLEVGRLADGAFQIELLNEGRASLARQLAVTKWSATLCLFQAVEGQFNADLDLSTLKETQEARQMLVELALYEGLLEAERSQQVHIFCRSGHCNFEDLLPNIQRAAMLKAVRQFFADVSDAEVSGRRVSLRSLALRRLTELQKDL
jgi:hypothetical protein